jgi:hypothetical protein
MQAFRFMAGCRLQKECSRVDCSLQGDAVRSRSSARHGAMALERLFVRLFELGRLCFACGVALGDWDAGRRFEAACGRAIGRPGFSRGKGVSAGCEALWLFSMMERSPRS